MTATIAPEAAEPEVAEAAKPVVEKEAPPRKPLRIRPELLPASAKYCTFDEREYIMLPVEDFGDWLEDIEDRLDWEDYKNNPEPGIPFEDVLKEIAAEREAKQ